MHRTTTQRGYGATHQTERARRIAAMRDGDPCARCTRPMYHGQPLDLDHHDNHVTYRGLTHAHCNRRAAAIKGNRERAHRRRIIGWQSRAW